MAFSLNNFLGAYKSQDKLLKIYDSNGLLLKTIDPFKIVTSFASNNLLILKNRTSTTTLDFSTSTDAKLALEKIQAAITILTNKSPLFVDSNIKNFVSDSLTYDNIQGKPILLDENGDLIITTDGEILQNSAPIIGFLHGTSSTPLQIPEIGEVVNLTTQRRLGFVTGQYAQVYNNLVQNYYGDDYVEEEPSLFFEGYVESYVRSTGVLTIAVLNSVGLGATDSNNQIATFSTWYINVTGRYQTGSGGPTGPIGPVGPTGSTGGVQIDTGTVSFTGDILPGTNSTYNIGSNELKWNSLYSNSIFVNGLTVSSDGESISFTGDILPSDNDVYNLGSPALQWKSLYVGSQSLVVGGLTISSHDDSIVVNSINLGSIDSPVKLGSNNGSLFSSSTMSVGSVVLDNAGDVIRDGVSILYRYSGTSSTPLQLPNEGYVANITTQDRLGFKQGQSLLVYNTIENLYAVDDYVDDTGSYFVGEVTGYNFTTGLLELIVSYSPAYGLTNNDGIVPTYSFWNIEISPSNYAANLSITSPEENGLVTSDGSLGLVGHNNLIFDGYTFSIEATTKFQQTVEVLNTSTASSTIEYNFVSGSIWIHDDLSNDFQPDFQNVPESNMRVITSTIIIEQGGTAYLPTSPILINGSTYSINWVGATPPVGNPGQTDVVGFSFIRRNDNWSVLAQVSTFG